MQSQPDYTTKENESAMIDTPDILEIPASNPLKRGDLVWCAWSRWGKQAAQILNDPRSGRRVSVMKWSANGRRWIGPIRVLPNEILGRRHPMPFDQRS